MNRFEEKYNLIKDRKKHINTTLKTDYYDVFPSQGTSVNLNKPNGVLEFNISNTGQLERLTRDENYL